MRKTLLITILLSVSFIIQSCSVRKIFHSQLGKTSKQILSELNSKTVKYSHLYLSYKVNFNLNNKTKNVKGSLELEKGKHILTSLNFMGLPFSKILITPDSLTFYEKLSKQYYHGAKKPILDRLIGLDLDLGVLQNVLIGNTLEPFDGKNQKLISRRGNRYVVKGNLKGKIPYVAAIDQATFKVIKQKLVFENMTLLASYIDFKKDNNNIPKQIHIEIKEGDILVLDMMLTYKKIKFLKKNNYTLKIPKKYREISL